MNDVERLQTASDLAGMDVEVLTKRDRLAWERRLADYFRGPSGTGVVGSPVEWAEDGAPDKGRLDYPTDFENLQKSAKALLDGALDGQRAAVHLSYWQKLEPGGLVRVQSTIMSTFAVVLTAALVSEGTDRLARCEHCYTVFVRNRNDARFCKRPHCVAERNSASFQKYIRTSKGKEARKRQIDRQRERRQSSGNDE